VMGSGTEAPAARRWQHEHEGSQVKASGKVRAVGSHRASGATTGRQNRAARWRLSTTTVLRQSSRDLGWSYSSGRVEGGGGEVPAY
jgi:hypothetical protein